VSRYDMRGTPIQELRRPLKWDNTWNEQNTGPRAWDRLGIRGVMLPKYDETLCTGCSGLYGPILTMIMASYTGPLNEIEVLTGKRMKPSGRAKQTLLLGNCMIKENRKDPAVQEAVLVKGCPPSVEAVFEALERCGVRAREDIYAGFRRTLIDRYKGKEGFDERLLPHRYGVARGYFVIGHWWSLVTGHSSLVIGHWITDYWSLDGHLVTDY
jgi:hypothetical protein